MAASGDGVFDVDKNANFDVSIMLFGSLAMGMTIVHMLNASDPDIKKVSWEIINKSVCTLIGVLISTSWSNALQWATGATSTMAIFLVNLGAFVVWYFLMHVALASVDEYRNREDLATYKNKLHFVAPLVSIIGGCSCMKVWASVQILVVEQVAKSDLGWGKHRQILCAVAVTFFMMGFMKMVHVIMRQARDKVAKYDGFVDPYEEAWMCESSSCEDNVDTMAMAFMIVQCCRFALTDHLPTAAGLNPPSVVVNMELIRAVFCLSTLFISLFMLANFLDDTSRWHSGKRLKKRVKFVLKNCTGFCWLYSGTWLAAHYVGTRVIGSCIQAAGTTIWCFLVIWVIDFFKDMECTDATFDKQLQSLYQPIALLIGFSWKLAFAGSLKQITQEFQVFPEPVETLIVTILLCAVMIPGWQLYILPVLFPVPVATAKVAPSALDQNVAELNKALLAPP